MRKAARGGPVRDGKPVLLCARSVFYHPPQAPERARGWLGLGSRNKVANGLPSAVEHFV
jgi:hypothetical protein